jgi:hypothetical protein
VDFARSSRLFVLIGILGLYGGGVTVIRFVGLCSIGLGVLLGMLSLSGIGRPANEPYKAPWIALSLGSAMLLLVGLGAISAALRGTAQGSAPLAEGPAPAPFIDRTNGFRLDHPGEGWNFFSNEEARTINEAAAAGAQRGQDLGGFVFVETPDPGFRIAGREQEVGKRMIDQIDVDDKRVVFIRPDEVDGRTAVRCQVVGTVAGRGIRYEAVALMANGRLYRLTALGPSDQTSDNGLTFRPFMAAFHILPTRP